MHMIEPCNQNTKQMRNFPTLEELCRKALQISTRECEDDMRKLLLKNC